VISHRCRGLRAGLVLACFLSSVFFVSGGCSPEGTGSVKVQDRTKIQEKLTKGAKLDPKGANAGDDMGVKFRRKN